MFSVMFGLTGVFLGFYLLGLPLSFTALVGIVTLVGINVNDVIVMIDTMNRHRREGRPVREAAVHGATDRLRPILSTTLTTTAGLIPLALSDPAWMPLCAAVISGELVSTLMSVVFMPGIYLLVTRDSASV
jgi:multidrug efflux pump subunit AcrB